MIWLHILGAVLCWLVALGAFGIFFLLLDECWHRGSDGLRIGHEVVGAVIFGVIAALLVWAGIALSPDKESWRAWMNTPVHLFTVSATDLPPPASPCASKPE